MFEEVSMILRRKVTVDYNFQIKRWRVNALTEQLALALGQSPQEATVLDWQVCAKVSNSDFGMRPIRHSALIKMKRK